MRIVFLLVLLAGSIFYSYIAFSDLNFLTRTGRLGPGFFPRLVGIGLVFFSAWVLLETLRARVKDDMSATVWRDVLILIVLAVGYAVLLRLFGGFIATVIYLGLALTLLNQGRHVQNGILSLVIPSCVYLLFDKALNANMPPALFDLPF
ncbi:MAG: tripartite tricarboxylate transporter TctB family protein [Pseudorhodobacter sp.]|nr:tripartite tricarboxylate transporter TctB family protein [Pseudorhodobacter sp.]